MWCSVCRLTHKLPVVCRGTAHKRATYLLTGTRLIVWHHLHTSTSVAKWQTRRLQNPVFARTCGFESHLRYKPPGLSPARETLPLRWLNAAYSSVAQRIRAMVSYTMRPRFESWSGSKVSRVQILAGAPRPHRLVNQDTARIKTGCYHAKLPCHQRYIVSTFHPSKNPKGTHHGTRSVRIQGSPSKRRRKPH